MSTHIPATPLMVKNDKKPAFSFERYNKCEYQPGVCVPFFRITTLQLNVDLLGSESGEQKKNSCCNITKVNQQITINI